MNVRRSSPCAWLLPLATLLVFCVSPQSRAQFTFASDQGSNYGGSGEPGWTNGANAGTGFAAWSFASSTGSGGFAGAFIGDPSAAGVTGMSSESFGLFANPVGSGAYIFTDRSLSSAMQVGDTFSFQWGINWDGENGVSGNKGFTLYTGAPGTGQVINVNNGGSSDIQFNGASTGFGFGVNVMNWTFSMIDATTLSVSANDRDGAGTFSTNITVSGGLSSLRLYATNMASGTERQPYYNNFLLTNSGLFYVATVQTEARYLTGAGNLAKTGNGTLTISGTTNNFTGTVGITNGAIRVTAGSALGSSSGVSVQSGAALEYSGGITVNRNTTINGTGVSTGGALRNISGNNTHSGSLTLGSASRIASDADTLTISGAVSGSNVGLTVGGAGHTVMQSAIGIGTGRLTKENAGTLTLTANNTFTGNTLISGGALRLGNGGTTGAVTGTLTNNGTLIYHRSDNIAQSGVISGTGAVIKQGAGKLTLSNANTYSGTTTVSDGTLLATTSTSLGTTAGGTTVEDGATLEISSGATIAENITITGSGVGGGGAIRSLGDGQNTLSGTITLGGNARINADAPIGSVTTLASLGSLGFTVSSEYTFIPYTQSSTNLTLTAATSGDTLAGQFGSIYDWSSVSSFGLRMSVAGTNPDLPFEVVLYDGEFNELRRYDATTVGLTSTSSITTLSLLSSTSGLNAVEWLEFKWNGTISSTSVSLFDVVSVPTSGLTISGNVNVGSNVLTVGSANGAAGTVADGLRITGVISGAGGMYNGTATSLVKDGGGTLYLSGNNTFTGDTRILDGALAIGTGASTNALGVGSDLFISSLGMLAVSGNVSVSSLQGAGAGDAGTVELSSNSVLTVNGAGKTMTMAGNIIGDGGLRLAGNAATVLTLSGDNSFQRNTFINAGTLVLAGEGGNQALRSTAAVSVASGAKLLLQTSNQVRDFAGVTLSGGTIQRGSGVSEVFGNLSLTTASFLDFGTGDVGTLRFGTYTPSSLLTVQNFLPGNKLQFGSTLTEAQLTNPSLFSFSSSFTTGTESGFFTITAIPEPSTYVVAAGLLGMLLWSQRRRLVRR
jgi:fibronectin-binding autotransporter adhesin